MKKITKTDYQQFEKRNRGRFFNSLTGFKPINLIGTVDSNGLTNLAIISSVIHLGANPALIGFISRPHSVPRHTLENIQQTGFYTINHVKESFYKQAHQTSARYEKEQSEFDAVKLESLFRDDFLAPFVKESSIQIGMRFIRAQDIPENGTVLIIGEVECIYLPENILLKDGTVDLENAGSICGAGLDGYHRTQKISRLNYAKPNIDPYEI